MLNEQSMQQPDTVVTVHRLQVLCAPELVATIDALRRNSDGPLPTISEVVREAIEEKAARDLGNGRKQKGIRG